MTEFILIVIGALAVGLIIAVAKMEDDYED